MENQRLIVKVVEFVGLISQSMFDAPLIGTYHIDVAHRRWPTLQAAQAPKSGGHLVHLAPGIRHITLDPIRANRDHFLEFGYPWYRKE
jgi:hypothetical protein